MRLDANIGINNAPASVIPPSVHAAGRRSVMGFAEGVPSGVAEDEPCPAWPTMLTMRRQLARPSAEAKDESARERAAMSA
jgi:hypothetical protein